MSSGGSRSIFGGGATFAVDVLTCPRCQGRMKLLAIVKAPSHIASDLAAAGEPTEPPRRSPKRGPPYWRSRLLRRLALGELADDDTSAGDGSGTDATA